MNTGRSCASSSGKTSLNFRSFLIKTQLSNFPKVANFPTFQFSNFPIFQLSKSCQLSNFPIFQLSNFPTGHFFAAQLYKTQTSQNMVIFFVAQLSNLTWNLGALLSRFFQSEKPKVTNCLRPRSANFCTIWKLNITFHKIWKKFL